MSEQTVEPVKVCRVLRGGSWLAVVVGAIAVLAATLVLVSTTSYGARVWPDSVLYISAARNLVAGRGMVDYWGTAMTRQPPLYPALLAAILYVAGVDPLVSARVLGAVAFALIVLLSGVLLHRLWPRRRVMVVLGSLCIALSAGLLDLCCFAMTEPAFIILVLLFLLAMQSFLREGGWRHIGLAALWAGLACATRVTGVVLLPAGVILLAVGRSGDVRRKCRECLLFLGGSALPLLCWLVWVYRSTGMPLGHRSQSDVSVAQAAWTAFLRINWWFVPQRVLGSAYGLVAMAICIACAAAIAWKRGWLDVRGRFAETAPLAVFTIIFLPAVAVSVSLLVHEGTTDRLLTPAYVPMMALALLLYDGLGQPLRKRVGERRADWVMGLLLVVWLFYPLHGTVQEVGLLTQGVEGDFSSRQWRESATVSRVAQGPLDDHVVYSNAPDALYMLAGHRACFSISNKYLPADLRGCWPQSGVAYLVWFNAMHRSYLYTLPEIEGFCQVTPVSVLDDGAIYLLRKVSDEG